MLSLKREGLHYLKECLRKCACGMGRAVRILGPKYLRVPTEAEIWQLLLENLKGVQEICGRGWDIVRSIWEARAQSEPP